jgi:hypothetical protein
VEQSVFRRGTCDRGIWRKPLALAAEAVGLWVLIGCFVFCSLKVWVEGRFKRVGLVVLAELEECQAELICQSTSRIAVSGRRRRQEGASSRNCCFVSQDGGWVRKNQVACSVGLVAR